MKFTIEFHRVTYEKAFLTIEVAGIFTAEAVAKKVTADDPRLEFEPMSSVIGVHSVTPSKFQSEMPSQCT